jgi:hypothetical protein
MPPASSVFLVFRIFVPSSPVASSLKFVRHLFLSVLARRLVLDQMFTLHSHPGSNRTIYLDFDGAVLTG